MGKTNENMHRWGFANSPECPCGEQSQTMDHSLWGGCPQGPACTDKDLREVNNSIGVTRYDDDYIMKNGTKRKFNGTKTISCTITATYCAKIT